MMSSHFYAFLSRMKYINRWALMRNTSADTLSQHSHEVSAVAYALCVIGNRRYGKAYNGERASLLGLFHDMPEIITGDLPTPVLNLSTSYVKYFNPEIKDAYKKVEAVASEKLLATLPDDLREDFAFLFNEKESDEELWKIVKAADKISALIKCIEERKAGNMEFAKAEQSTLESIKNMNTDYKVGDFIYNADIYSYNSCEAVHFPKNMTPEEIQLWYQFLKKLPVTVNRQKNIGDFIVDFYISSADIVIEIDGRQHKMKDNAEADRLRDEELGRRGLKVLRYNNQSVRDNFNAVCMDILNNLGLKAKDLK